MKKSRHFHIPVKVMPVLPGLGSDNPVAHDENRDKARSEGISHECNEKSTEHNVTYLHLSVTRKGGGLKIVHL